MFSRTYLVPDMAKFVCFSFERDISNREWSPKDAKISKFELVANSMKGFLQIWNTKFP
jgi:hypothetical protein